MTEKKEFRTLVVASTATGIGLADKLSFSDIHECAEWLCGHPVFTHELVHKPTVERYRAEVIRQFPNMPTTEEAHADFEAAAVKATKAYGDKISVQRGSSERNASPIFTFSEMVAAR